MCIISCDVFCSWSELSVIVEQPCVFLCADYMIMIFDRLDIFFVKVVLVKS